MVCLAKEAFYSRLKSETSSAGSSPLSILASAADVDSLCALRIALQIFVSDNVRFSVFPVSSFSDPPLDLQGEQPLVVLLINWGAPQHLRRLLKLGPRVRVFVVDSHRPVHLSNLSDTNNNVVVLYDQDNDGDFLDFRVEELASHLPADAEDESEVESDEESDGENGEDELEGGRKRRRRDEDDEDVARQRKRRRQRRFYYSRGSFHGRAAGLQMFEIAHSVHMNNNECLWLACVALTDQFVHERLALERYQSEVISLEDYVDSSGSLEVLTSVTLKDGTVVRTPDMARITYDMEPRLMLLREWTLYDSMLCSTYVATKLKTWNDGGHKRLRLLLATMGIALGECQQKFQYMSRETRRRMKEELDKYSRQFGLEELYYLSFHRKDGYRSNVCAADVVYGVTALLEAETEQKHGEFWEAYKALSPSSWQQLQRGMQLAIKVQRAIIRQGSLAITKQGFIKKGKDFRWLKLEDGPDVERLAHPMSLTRFCYFLMDALKEQGYGHKPIICAARKPQTQTALVVGASPRPRLGATTGNKFGGVFRQVAIDLGLQFEHDGFDAAWIRLDAAAVSAFMLRISESLSSIS